MSRYAIAKIWEKFLIMLWLMKLEKEKKNPLPMLWFIRQSTQREDSKTFYSSCTVVRSLRDPGSVPL